MKIVAILGCGWLGLPLAKAMLANEMKVYGSTTSESKLEGFAKEGIQPYLISLNENSVEGAIKAFLQSADTLIIDIPPKAKSGEDFTRKMQALIPHIETSGIGQVLFVSSISVYGSNQGEVTEEAQPDPDTESGRQLLETEQLLHSNSHFKTTILRFGGLVGGERHPVYHLAGRENLSDPDAPINLIHRDDCIGIILEIIKKNTWGETFNATAPFHPTRKTFYTQKAAKMGLALPVFVPGGRGGKLVGTCKVEESLGYRYSVTDTI